MGIVSNLSQSIPALDLQAATGLLAVIVLHLALARLLPGRHPRLLPHLERVARNFRSQSSSEA
jgi:hypothetical protein